MAEARRPNVPSPNQTHVRAPHERDYEREDRFQKNPQGKTTAPSGASSKRPPPRSAVAPRRGR
jgi:hypothetical protein